jgi:hypothetical protein
MYNNGESFGFITDKIQEIKVGLFKSEINSELMFGFLLPATEGRPPTLIKRFTHTWIFIKEEPGHACY